MPPGHPPVPTIPAVDNTSNDDDSSLQAFQVVILARYLLGAYQLLQVQKRRFCHRKVPFTA